MTDAQPTTWSGLKEFLAEDPRRGSSDPVSYGLVLEETTDPHTASGKWELLWYPTTGELIEHRPEADPAVRLIGRAPHRDYIDTAIEEWERHDRDVEVHRRRWQVTHPDQPASPRRTWRTRNGSDSLRTWLTWWERLMEGQAQYDVDDDDPLPDWGHTVDHVHGPLEFAPELWQELVPNAVAAVDEALRLERELRGRFNLAVVANLASRLEESAQALRHPLIEAYGAAHRDHPGKQTDQGRRGPT